MSRAALSLFVAVSIVAVSAVVREKLVHGIGHGAIATIVGECLLIGAWVAMWKPMEVLLHEWWAMRREKAVLARLSKTKVTASEPTTCGIESNETDSEDVAFFTQRSRPRRVNVRRRVVRRRVGR